MLILLFAKYQKITQASQVHTLRLDADDRHPHGRRRTGNDAMSTKKDMFVEGSALDHPWKLKKTQQRTTLEHSNLCNGFSLHKKPLIGQPVAVAT